MAHNDFSADAPLELTSGSQETQFRPTRRFSKKNVGAFQYRGLIGAMFLVPAGLLTQFSQPTILEGTWLNTTFDSFGWGAFFLGAFMRFWSTLYVGGRKCRTVVDQGPYSICRNPLYLGSCLIAISVAFFLKSMTLSGAIGLAILGYALFIVPTEEKVLLENLGEPYADYCRRVPRYFPRLSLFRTPERLEIAVKGLRLEAKRALVWIWLPILCELMTRLRPQPWWPKFFPLS